MSQEMLAEDLKTRWTPSDTQIAMAAAVFEARPDADLVLSSHLLLGKEYGWWIQSVTVEPVLVAKVAMNRPMKANDPDRPDDYHAVMADVVEMAARQAGERPCTIGYTVHNRDGTWSVFEEISDVPTVLERSTRKDRLD